MEFHLEKEFQNICNLEDSKLSPRLTKAIQSKAGHAHLHSCIRRHGIECSVTVSFGHEELHVFEYRIF